MGTVVSFDVPDWAGDPDGALAARCAGCTGSTPSSRPTVTTATCPAGSGGSLVRRLRARGRRGHRRLRGGPAPHGGYFTAAPGGVFDPSGYVKGWAVERAAAILSAAGSANHLRQRRRRRPVRGRPPAQGVTAARSARVARVGRGARGGWASPTRSTAVGSPSSSRRPTARSPPPASAERGAHIIDPHPAAPPPAWRASPWSAPPLAHTDAYATAAFAMGSAARDWPEALQGYEAYAITPTGYAWQTTNFPAHVAR